MGLGLDEDRYQLRPEELHFLNVSAGVVRKVGGSHFLEGGIQAGWLMGVRGVLEKEDYLFPWQRNREQQDKFSSELVEFYELSAGDPELVKPRFAEVTEVESGWMEKEGIRNWQFRPYVGYRWQSTDHWYVGGRAYYRLSSFGNSGQTLSLETMPVNFEFRAGYIF
jgi:hypothetical protein